MYNLSVQTFQIMFLIIQDLWIVQIIAFLEIAKRVVKGYFSHLTLRRGGGGFQGKNAKIWSGRDFKAKEIACN